jgi:RHS repeat-associated protein
MGSQTGFAVEGGKFVRISINENGKSKLVDGNPDQAKAAHSLVKSYLKGQLTQTDNVNQLANDQAFARQVLETYFEQVLDSNLSTGEAAQHMRKVFGDDPKIIALFAQHVDASWAQEIWSVQIEVVTGKVDPLPNQPVPQPADVIPAPQQAQGEGPVAPQAQKGNAKSPDLKGSASGTSNIGKSGGAPDGSPEGKGAADAPKDKKTGGDPIILASGCFYYQVNDLTVAGCGLGFSFTRTYMHQTRYNGPMGFCWDHSYNLWLRESQEMQFDGTLRNVVYRANGMVREDAYIQIIDHPVGDLLPIGEFPDAVFEGPPGFFDRMEKVGGRYTLLTPDGTRIEYGENLYVARIIDRNNNTMMFEYDAFLLRRVTDPLGKRFIFDYDEMNRLVRLRDEIGQREWRYFYTDNGDLLEADLVTDDGFVSGIDYRYLGPDYPVELQHNLTQIINPYGETTVENIYGIDPNGTSFNCVIRQRSDEGEFRYEYDAVFAPDEDVDADPINTPMRLARVIYPNNHVIEHHFNTQGNVVRKFERVHSEMGDFVIIESRYRYNADGKLVFERRAGGEVFEYLHQREAYVSLHGTADGASPIDKLAFGNVLQITQYPRPGTGETRRIVTTFTYHPHTAVGGGFGHLAAHRGPFYANLQLQALPGQAIPESFHDYDARGNLIRIRHGQVLQADGSPQMLSVVEYVYNSRGLPVLASNGEQRSETRYFEDVMRAGFAREIVIDSGGLALRTTFDVDLLGRVTRTTDTYGATTDTTYTAFDTPATQTLPESALGLPRPTITYTYDKAQRLRRVVTTVFNDDGTPHPQKTLVREDCYDAYGRLVVQSAGSETEPQMRVVRRVFDAANKVIRSTDALGNVVRNEYDERMYVRAVTHGFGTPDQSTVRNRYDITGQLVATIDALGHQDTIAYDPFLRVRRSTTRDGDETEYDYDAAGRMTNIRTFGKHPTLGVRVRWGETDLRYDAAGRIIERISHLFIPDVLPTPKPEDDVLLRDRYFYDATGRLVRAQNALGLEEELGYDRLGRLTYARDADGNETKIKHDDAARTATTTHIERGRDDTGQAVTQVFRTHTRFDKRNLPIAVADGLGNTIRYAYDSRGLVTQTILPDGHIVKTAYDIFGQPIRTSEESGTTTTLSETQYDANGNVIAIITPSGGRTNYALDALNRVVSATRDDGASTRFHYDAAGRVIASQDANGVVARQSYSPSGRLLSVDMDTSTFHPISGMDYTPTQVSRSTFVHSPLGYISVQNAQSTSSYRRDSLGRVLEEVTDGARVVFVYDALNRLVRCAYPGGRTIDYAYTPGGSLLSARQTAAGAAYPGDASQPANRVLFEVARCGSKPLTLSFGKTHAVRMSYAANGRIAGSDWLRKQDGSSLLQERVLFNARGLLRTQQLDTQTRTLDYDAMGRLVAAREVNNVELADASRIRPPDAEITLSISQPDIDAAIERVLGAAMAKPTQRAWVYTLDANGNRTVVRETLSANAAPVLTTFVADRHDRYTHTGGAGTSYDANGNLLDDGALRYRYDALGRLASVTSGSSSVTFERDALGRLARMTTPSGTRTFVYAGSRAIEWRKVGGTGGDTIECQIVPLERPNQIGHLACGGRDYAPVFDIMDSVMGWVDGTGAMVGQTRYDPFGRSLGRIGQWPAPFGFAGYLEDGVTPLYHLAARCYNPQQGRFIQPDPLGFVDGLNVYHYAHNAPGTLTDYFGYEGTGVDNWWSKTAIAKAVAPYAKWLDDKVTFAAKVAGNLAMSAATGYLATVVLGAMGPVGWLIGAGLLGYSLYSSYQDYSQEAMLATQANTYNGASPLLATLLMPIGGKSIYEAWTGRGYFNNQTLSDDARAYATSDALMNAVSTIYGGWKGWGKWKAGKEEVVNAMKSADTVISFGEDFTAIASMAAIKSQVNAKWLLLDHMGKLTDALTGAPASLANSKAILFIGHGNQRYPEIRAALGDRIAQMMPARGFHGKFTIGQAFSPTSGDPIQSLTAEVTLSAKEFAQSLIDHSFQGGTLVLGACATGQYSKDLGGSVGQLVMNELKVLIKPTTVFAPKGLSQSIDTNTNLLHVTSALFNWVYPIGWRWGKFAP